MKGWPVAKPRVVGLDPKVLDAVDADIAPGKYANIDSMVRQDQRQATAWSDKTNAKQRGVDRQFHIEDARLKRERLYPKINT